MQGQLESTSNSVSLHLKEALLFCFCFVFFRYCYMALILKFKSFILVLQIWKIKIRKGKYTVFHTVSVVNITWLASSYFNGDG